MRGAPLSYAWLAVLFVTTRIQRSAGRRKAREIQRHHSTNLRRLSEEPSRVLVASLFWLDHRSWWPHVPVFIGVVAPAERRLRSWRWLLVGSAAHVLGTYVSQGYLRAQIRSGSAPRRLVNARDVGVSYFVYGVGGALSGYIVPRWRARCQAVAVAWLVANVAVRPTFAEVGHLSAFLVGLAAAPNTCDRNGLDTRILGRRCGCGYPPQWHRNVDVSSGDAGVVKITPCPSQRRSRTPRCRSRSARSQRFSRSRSLWRRRSSRRTR